MESLRQALRMGVRTLAKSPGFAAVAILTLALGIGANAAIFSIVYGVLQRPLPYHDPASLILVRAQRDFAGTDGHRHSPPSRSRTGRSGPIPSRPWRGTALVTTPSKAETLLNHWRARLFRRLSSRPLASPRPLAAFSARRTICHR